MVDDEQWFFFIKKLWEWIKEIESDEIQKLKSFFDGQVIQEESKI